MFSSPIGIQAKSRGSVWQVAGRQVPQGVDVRVQAIGKRVRSPTCCSQSRAARTQSFSPLRFLWWASLLVGARAQQTTPFPASIELGALSGGDGFVLNGDQMDDQSGYSVASAGDVNGDGIADLVIGASNANSGVGTSYVVFGRAGLGSSGSLALSSLNGTNGFVLNGERDGSGQSVASAGDVNGDGIADLMIGAPVASPNNNTQAGTSYVVFGRVGLGGNGSLALWSLNGTSGFALIGGVANGFSGSSVASAGDVNGDGIADLVIGANSESYVVFGRVGLGSSGSLALSSLNGTNGFILNNKAANYSNGYSVASAGDVNGDRIPDLVIGAEGYITSVGKSYVVFGRVGLGGNGSLALSSLNGTSGLVLNGELAGDYTGNSVASAGDVNGDGIADLVIGARRANPSGKIQAGKSYVVFGRVGLGGNGSLELSSLNGTSGFVLNGDQAGDQSGWSVASAGDMNGDGIADLVIGVPEASPSGNTGAGTSYVVFGRVGLGGNGSFELSSLNRTSGLVLNGELGFDNSGWSVASAGDVNRDGIADLVIGAESASPSGNSNAGKSYVVFGRKLTTALVPSATTPQQTPGATSSQFVPGGLSTSSPTTTLTAPPSSPSIPLVTTNDAATPISGINTSLRSTSFPNMMSLSSQTATTASPLDSAPTGKSLPLIIGVVAAVAALACSLLGAGLYFVRRKRNAKKSVEEGIALKGAGAISADYTSIEAIQQGMALARASDQYLNVPKGQPEGHYSSPFDVKPPKDGEQYDQVSLAQLNAEVEEHRKAQLRQARSNYDDISPPRLSAALEMHRKAELPKSKALQEGELTSARADGEELVQLQPHYQELILSKPE